MHEATVSLEAYDRSGTPAGKVDIQRVRSIVAGKFHTCAVLGDGTLQCWGKNKYGQLGDGTTISRFTPKTVPGLSGIREAYAGEFHTCAVSSERESWCWGENDFGQLGIDANLDGVLTPQPSRLDTNGISIGMDKSGQLGNDKERMNQPQAVGVFGIGPTCGVSQDTPP